MKLTLKDWLEIDAAREAASKSLAKLSQLFHEHAVKAGPNSPDGPILMRSWEKVMDAKSFLPKTRPGLEWTGGNSDDPKNFKMTEPECVGYLKRKFTPEEVAAAQITILGPCQWRLPEPTPTASPLVYHITESEANADFYLGSVSDPHNRNPETLSKVIEDTAWPAFQATQPDSDSMFIDYLIKHHQFAKTDDPVPIIVTG